MRYCLECNSELPVNRRRYCCHTCGDKFRHKKAYKNFKKEHGQTMYMSTPDGICRYCRSRKTTRGVSCDECRRRMRDDANRRGLRLRQEVLTAYGEKCQCCGENIPEFLAIDHINNDGNKHRRQVRSLYIWLKQNGFPKDNFQLLCHNCNIGKYRNNGICPHKLHTRKSG